MRAFRPPLPIALSAFGLIVTIAPALAQVTFVDVSVEYGVAVESFGRSVATVDLDGDGLLDLIGCNDSMPNSFFRQLPDHRFEDASAAWGAPVDTAPHRALLAGDLDNDGDPDLYQVNGLPPADNQLLRNDISSGGGLVDVTAQAGDAILANTNGFGGTLIDYDKDGLLDVFVTTAKAATCTLLRNTGDLAFEDVTVAAGISHVGSWRHCSSGDVNADGWPDVGVANAEGANVLYSNEGNGTFTNVAGYAGLSSPDENFGMILVDFDNDGWQDVFLPKWNKVPGEPSRIYRNLQGAGFEVVAELGSHTDMGHNVADLDADGFPDIYIGTGSPPAAALDILFLVEPDGLGGVTATDVSESCGLLANGPTRCHGMGIGDLDGDGDLDVYVNNGGPADQPETSEVNFLWLNDGNANGWSELALRGVRSNRSAIGAAAVATTTAGKQVHRYLDAGRGFGNTNSPVLHFGLGADNALERYDVRWPSGIVQTVLAPPAFARLDLVETGLLLGGDPVPGGTLVLRACGPAGHEVSVFLSFETAETQFPEFGGIALLAQPVFPFGSIDLDADGLGTLTFEIPDEPGLVGLTVHLQALVHDGTAAGSQLTNRIDITVG